MPGMIQPPAIQDKYKPGELIRLMQQATKVSCTPKPLDIVLYVEYILLKMGIQDLVVKLSINNGQYIVGKFQDSVGKQVFVEDFTGDTVFHAGLESGSRSWEIFKFETGPWMLTLEYAFDKVRTCLDSPEKFASEFPPMGIYYRSSEDTNVGK